MKHFKAPLHGRGAVNNPDNRFHERHSEAFDDGWDFPDDEELRLRTELFADDSKTIINYNQSPDVPFDRSINPYRGCEHGCVYCFARPTHAYLDCSPGLEFESKIFYKPRAAELLKQELSKKSYRCQPIALGINTDAYQPVERELRITRDILEVLLECKHPVSIVTKSKLIERDIDVLSEMAAQQLIHVMVSVTTLDKKLARHLEPRATAPHRRVEIIAKLRSAGIPVGVLVAPVIPFLNDHEIERILKTVHAAGALMAGYVMLRLPHEIKTLFSDWLEHHAPLKKEHVLNRIRDLHEGELYRAEFGTRMCGSGVYAELINQRFAATMKKLKFPGMPSLDSSRFIPPCPSGQMGLF